MVAGPTKMHDALHRKFQIMNFDFPQLCETVIGLLPDTTKIMNCRGVQ